MMHMTWAMAALALGALPAAAAPGVSDSEVRLGQTMPYSGPAASFAAMGMTEAAYYRMINETGGLDGRHITFISLDDSLQPNRTVEQTRRLVEHDDVLAIVGSLGTATNAAVQRYLNQRRVPQLFISTGAARFADPQHYPWTLALALNQVAEAGVHARRLLTTRPDSKIGLLYQNDDFGREYTHAFRAALGARAATMIVADASYEVQDPTIDQQLLMLRQAGADVLLDVAIPRFAAMAIRRIADLGWKPLHIIPQPSISLAATLRPAGLDNAVGVIGAETYKDPDDPQWAADAEVVAYRQFMQHYRPDADLADRMNVLGYVNAAATVLLLTRCRGDLSRENVIRQASHLAGVHVPLLLPGITLNTSATQYAAIRQMRLQRFDGERWRPLGDVERAEQPDNE